jgi:hypothetical protein
VQRTIDRSDNLCGRVHPLLSGAAEFRASAFRKVVDVNPNSIPALSIDQRKASTGTFDRVGLLIQILERS